MSRRSILNEVKRVRATVSGLDTADEHELLPPCNGIDRIIFQARFVNRARKKDPEGLAEIIEAAKKSLKANLNSRPDLWSHRAVISALLTDHSDDASGVAE